MSETIRRMAVVLILGAVLIAGCSAIEESTNSLVIKSSDTIITETPSLTNFDRVSAAYTFDVTLVPGDTFAVTLRIDENVQEHLDVHVSRRTLYLDLKDRDGGYSVEGDVIMEATVTLPVLRGVELSGASTASMSGFEQVDTFAAQLSGASGLTGDVAAGALTLTISGASHAELTGTASSLAVELSGASTASLSGFESVEEFDAQLSGASSLTGDVMASAASLSASGDSEIELSGAADRMTVALSGSSKALLFGFEVAGDVDINASGASRAEVVVNGTLTVEASGTSRIVYQGDPTLGEMDTSGDASVEAAG